MGEKLTMRLLNPEQGSQAINAIRQHAEVMLQAGNKMVVELRPERRSLDQNARFHALCTDIAKSGLHWVGKPRTADQWKVLLVSGHAIVTKAEVEVVPGLEDEPVNLRELTSRMSVKRAASLIEYTHAFMAARKIPINAGKQWEGWQ